MNNSDAKIVVIDSQRAMTMKPLPKQDGDHPSFLAHEKRVYSGFRQPPKSHFTDDQQREIGSIIELWWRAKSASLMSQRVDELEEKLNYLCKKHGLHVPTAQELALAREK